MWEIDRKDIKEWARNTNYSYKDRRFDSGIDNLRRGNILNNASLYALRRGNFGKAAGLDPLYIFKLDKETGEVTKNAIESYVHMHNGFLREECYVFDANLSGTKHSRRHDISEAKLDRFTNNCYITFDSNEVNALSAIERSLIEEVDKIQVKLDLRLAKLEAFRNANNIAEGGFIRHD